MAKETSKSPLNRDKCTLKSQWVTMFFGGGVIGQFPRLRMNFCTQETPKTTDVHKASSDRSIWGCYLRFLTRKAQIIRRLSYRRRWGLLCFLCSLQGMWCIHRCSWPHQRGVVRRKWWWCHQELEFGASLLHSWRWRGPCRVGQQTHPGMGWRSPHSALCRSLVSAMLPWEGRIDGNGNSYWWRTGKSSLT